MRDVVLRGILGVWLQWWWSMALWRLWRKDTSVGGSISKEACRQNVCDICLLVLVLWLWLWLLWLLLRLRLLLWRRRLLRRLQRVAFSIFGARFVGILAIAAGDAGYGGE